MTLSVERLIADDWQRWSDTPAKLIGPLHGGLTNRSFLIDAGDEKLVLRINAPNSLALDLNRAAEAEALRQASSKKLCAPLVYIDPGHRYLLTRFIQGVPLQLDQTDALARMSHMLRQLHQLAPISAQLHYAHKADHYWQSVNLEHTHTPIWQTLLELRAKITPQLERLDSAQGAHCLCHNDLLPDNLIVDNSGELRAIDWEYAATGEPYFDLATVVEGFKLSHQQRQTLLTEYLQRPAGASELQKLDMWQKVYRYLSILWYAVQREQASVPPITAAALQQQIHDLLTDID
uniref:choline kinase family protein n=1 Tax=Microbulbifer agarilyticus TaxID=260552 RepID=UPI00025582F9|nr:choline kinase family protein [Microbulbifer agarilyticus]